MNTETEKENATLPEQRQLRTLHLFAGAGGGILADILLGHRPVGAVEIEEYPRRVLLARQRDGILPRFPIWDDVSTFDGKPWRGRVDVVCGGFPCQDISSAGKGAGIEGERSGMWKHMARIIGEIRPSYAFVENSPMLVGRGLAVVLGDLAEMGYDARWCVLGAVDAGAPHRRDRIWILATDSNLRGCNDGSGIERKHEVHYAEIGETQKDQQSGSIGQHRTGEACADVANSEMFHAQRCWLRPGQSELGGSDCWSRRWDAGKSDWWTTEPNVGRVAHGVANRVDRLKAIGNGQVPQVAALAWKILRQQP